MWHSWRLILPILFVILLSTGNSLASDLKIIDSDGTAVEVKSACLDYTIRFGFYTVDIENSGIRVYRGEGELTVDWEKIKEIRITWQKRPYEGEISLKDGSTTTVKFIGSPNIKGRTELGYFEIGLGEVKSIVPIKMKEVPNLTYKPMNAVVTDANGTVTHVKNISSVIVHQGRGAVEISPVLMEKLTVSQLDKGQATGELVLKNGTTLSRATFTGSVSGDTDLGDFSLAISKVRSIVFRESEEK